MPKDNKPNLKDLEKKLDLLINRFDEQKGIIDAYIKKEREWKKNKLAQANEIKKLEKVNSKLKKVIKSHEQ